ncbi:MAG: pyridoxal phosphate-dependent aminotransferase [Candidatus Marinimicrobia bacterium]|nr:pyridoxal phosphate-dependent aminotransferase [Candidatus Neomarinimicrobiota bacterium]MCH7954515.1 pyridoxal phosphate-dependent aminotransferase [Candidatus Neomarinimicrobiota bacterium]
MVKLSDRMDKIQPSKTMAVMALAKDLKAQGIDIVDLGAGEPDFPTPEYIRDLATKAMADGYTKYTKVDGIPELKEAIALKLKRDNDLNYSPEQIIVSCGAKHAIYNAMMAVVNEGDEVIILSPYWVSFPEMVKMADGEPVFAELDPKADYRRTLKPFEEYVTDKTVAVILNSPSNPVGSLLDDDFIAEVIKTAREKDLLIISDETYERITFENKYKSIAAYEGGNEVTLTVNSMSKTYSMTGWRIGFAAGAEKLIKAMSKIQSQVTSNANSIAQKASVGALNGDQSEAEMMRDKYWERRDVVYEGLSNLPGIEVNKPEGSFFIFPDVSAHYGKSVNGKSINGSVEFAEFLIEHAKVVVIPGVAFGSDNNVRISFAVPKEEIEKGIERIGEALNLLN